jgi:hypothetical protein
MEELDPSVVAAADRVNASFLWLTKELMTLHVQANSAEPGSPAVSSGQTCSRDKLDNLPNLLIG